MTQNRPGTDSAQAFLKSRLPEARRFARASVFLASANGLALIAGAWVLAGIVRQAVFGHADRAAVAPWLLGLYALRALLVFAADHCAFLGAARVKNAVRRDLATSLFDRGPAGLTEESSGAVINAYVEGVEALQGYYALTVPSRVTAAFVPLAVLIFIAPADWVSAAVLLVAAPLIPVFMIWIGRGAEALNQRQWRRMAFMSGHFLDTIQGLTTLKLFNASRREGAVIRRIAEDFRRDTMAVLRVAFLSSLALEFFATVSIAMVAVLIGFRLLWGQLDFGHGFFVLLLAPEFFLPLRKMGTHYHAKMEAVAAAESLAALIQPFTADRSAGKPCDGGPVAIRFEDVTFAYPDREPVLRNASFSIAAGEKLALAGPSGSGKSTIILLLLGFLRPQVGRIFINGTPLDALDASAWRQALSWLPQRPRLFKGGIADNIGLACPDAAADRLRGLIDDCGIGDFADAGVGENGTGLSGGQIQRVALARALIRSSGLLLLDEPTAHLDRETEGIVHAALTKHAAGATVVFAAHRAASLAWADRVLHVRDGTIISEESRAA